jgi:diacylglycerol kinase (ATP)
LRVKIGILIEIQTIHLKRIIGLFSILFNFRMLFLRNKNIYHQIELKVPKEKIAFIINPISGRRKKVNLQDCILQNLDLEKFDPAIYTTNYQGHANIIAYQLVQNGYSKIVAVGGDGTVNEIAAALIDQDATLGILPCGSGNGLARHLGIPTNIFRAIELLNNGRTTRIDAGKINNTWFFCTCGVGFDARVGHKFTKVEKRGFFAYIKTVIREFRNYSPKKYRFWIDGEKYKRKAFLITIANASQYGNDAYIAPNAIIDDGLFDICIIKPFPVFKAPFIGMKLMNRSLESSAYTEILRGKEIRFKKPKKKYIFHYDGEPAKFKKERISITILPTCLNIIVPVKK